MRLLRRASRERNAGEAERAVETYLRAARLFEARGSNDRALAAYKLAVKLAPDRRELCAAAAEAYERLALRREAIEQYRRAAELYDQHAELDRACELRERILALDSEQIDVRLRLAEQYFDREKNTEALAMLRQALTILREKRRFDEYWVVARQALRHAPADVELARLFARVHLRRGELDRALDVLERFLEARGQLPGADPKVSASGALLCSAARAYLAHGREGHAAQCCRRILAVAFVTPQPESGNFTEETERERQAPISTPDWEELSLAELIDTSEPTRRAPFACLLSEQALAATDPITEQLVADSVSLFEPDLSIHERSTRQVAPMVVDLVLAGSDQG